MLSSINLIGQGDYDCLKKKGKIKTYEHFRKQSCLSVLHNKDIPCAYPLLSYFQRVKKQNKTTQNQLTGSSDSSFT